VAAREALEETGLKVTPVRLVGVFDSRLINSPFPLHLYHLLFVCRIDEGTLTLTHETQAYGYFAEEDVAALALHRGHETFVAAAFKAFKGETTEAVFQ
jgi:8-oxo-dGTP pyrophosphatase MutT (NUDIX family)